jgi:hypothetical protein
MCTPSRAHRLAASPTTNSQVFTLSACYHRGTRLPMGRIPFLVAGSTFERYRCLRPLFIAFAS